jgi:hypothetical protein
MPDPTREAYDRCFKKRLFFDTKAAEGHLRWLYTLYGANSMEVYECEIGQAETHYHVGHPPMLPGKRERLARLRTFGNDTIQTHL